MARLNLLPWRQIRREKEQKEFFIMWGVCLGVALCIVFSMHAFMRHEINSQKKINATLSKTIKMLDVKIEKIKTIQKERDAMIARMNIIQRLQNNRPLTVHLFDDLVKQLPEGVYLTSLEREGSKVTLKGRADSNSRVSDLMRSLEKSPYIINPVLTEIKTQDEKSTQVRHFILTFKQVDSIKASEALI